MRRLTGIELGPETCVLVRVCPDGGRVQVSAVYGLTADEWPDPHVALSDHLRAARRRKHLPRRARVVAWGLHQSASATDAATVAALGPLREAGFSVEAVLKPVDALAVLARTRPRPPGREAAAWLSINRHGAALAIVYHGELLYSREFDWHYRAAASPKEELLQRYSLVAHLAPEVRHAFDVVRSRDEVAVDAVITCGDLPDLRSLTMPLIEELDVEVETLDSLDGLTVSGTVRAEELSEKAPALRLACAVAAEEMTGGVASRPGRRAWQAAAALLVVAGLAWGAFRLLDDGDAPSARNAAASSSPATGPAATPRPPAPSATAPPAQPVERPAESNDPARPAATMGREEQAAPRTSGDDLKTLAAASEPATAGAASRPRTNAAAAAPRGRPAQLSSPALKPVPRAIRSAEPEREAVTGSGRGRVPLQEPLPSVNSILVSPDRRLAVVDGAIVREGDAVGRRVLVRIEPRAVVLREPSGYEVRVFIRRRVGAINDGGSAI